MAVPPGFDVGLRNAGEVGVWTCAASGIGDHGPLQIGSAADGAGFKCRIDGSFDPQAVVPVGAAVFVGGEEGGGSVRDSRGVAGNGGGDAEDLAHRGGGFAGRAGVESCFVEDVGFDSVGEGVGAAVTLDGDGIDAPYAVVQVAGIVLRNHECADAGRRRGCGGVVAVVVGVERRRVVYARVRGDDAGDRRDIGIALRRRGLDARWRYRRWTD